MEYMNISFSVSIEEAEEIIMNGISQCGIMPHSDILLNYLNSKGIRTCKIVCEFKTLLLIRIVLYISYQKGVF